MFWVEIQAGRHSHAERGNEEKTPRAWNMATTIMGTFNDYNRHVNYIHWNPVIHGHVQNVIDWPYSSFHRYVKQRIYERNWGHNENNKIDGKLRERCAS
jgi:hypothetical protein